MRICFDEIKLQKESSSIEEFIFLIAIHMND